MSDAPSSQSTRPRWLPPAIFTLLVMLAFLAWRVAGGPSASSESADTDELADAGAGVSNIPGFDPASHAALDIDLTRADKAAISGTVRDEADTPVSGAKVCAMANSRALRGLGDDSPRCVRSENNGHYRIEGLWPVPTEVVASAPGFVPGRWFERERERAGLGRPRWETELQLRPGQTREDIDLKLHAGAVKVSGVVEDIAGGGIEGAQVFANLSHQNPARSHEIGAAVVESGEDGHFELWTATGELQLSASAEGYAEASTRAVAPAERVVLALAPESVLLGKVVHAETGEGLPGVVVESGGGASELGETSGVVRTDAEGRFRITGLPPGSYKPIARGDTFYGEAEERVFLGLAEASEPLVIRAHPASYVVGHVVIASDTEGEPQPCPGGNVSLTLPHSDRDRARIEDGGIVRFRGLIPGEYEVDVRCDGYLSAEHYPALSLSEGALADATWEVSEGLALRGLVVDDAGEVVADVDVWAQPVSEGEGARERSTRGGSRTDTDGSFVIAGLLPGRYEVNAGGRGWGGGRPSPEQPVSVTLDNESVDGLRLVLPAVGGVRGRVIDTSGQPVAGVDIQVQSGDRRRRGASSTRSDEAGKFELHELRPGELRVVARKGGSTMRAPGTTDDDDQGALVNIEANAVTEVELVVARHDRELRGRVVDADGGPVVDAFVSAQRMSDRTGASGSRENFMVRSAWRDTPALTDQDGRFVLDQLPEGTFLVFAQRKGGGEASVEGVSPGDDVELVIQEGASLAGVVRVANEGALPDRFELSIHGEAQSVWRRESFFRTQGRWQIADLPAGHYEISVTSELGNAAAEAELDAGQQLEGIELTLQPLLTLRGRVVDLESGEPIPSIQVLANTSGPSVPDPERKNISDEDGRFVLEGVPSGMVNMMVMPLTGGESSYETQWLPLELAPEPTEQDLDDITLIARRLSPGDAPGDLGFTLEDRSPANDERTIVALVRHGGPAAGTGLAAKDEIVTIDGHDIRGENYSRFFALTRAPAGTKLSLGLADARTIELVLGPARK
ncbi:carboxypeptidase regulatory-like domain-containing protein [Pseudenhygromyxa sp. WMMC2535]|uniref:carboxypeptidase regulatory-like domain-containing protein n=1 Tax=Pseudenhygromyxa sp. WMMC2535 TaxID=2712867 RepID=UPI0015561135|nr:carboxypeptidase regulatory-like domain-containing protein [Pseudenhygromyxa sp. WMMC2535]NVB37592.1 carboxypeptidase regulatory-like domain-containing protein [Pseudenhygromyxa sp. WMMC2535]